MTKDWYKDAAIKALDRLYVAGFGVAPSCVRSIEIVANAFAADHDAALAEVREEVAKWKQEAAAWKRTSEHHDACEDHLRSQLTAAEAAREKAEGEAKASNHRIAFLSETLQYVVDHGRKIAEHESVPSGIVLNLTEIARFALSNSNRQNEPLVQKDAERAGLHERIRRDWLDERQRRQEAEARERGMREAMEKAKELVSQYTRFDFYMWLTQDAAGRQSDPVKRAVEATAIIDAAIAATGDVGNSSESPNSSTAESDDAMEDALATVSDELIATDRELEAVKSQLRESELDRQSRIANERLILAALDHHKCEVPEIVMGVRLVLERLVKAEKQVAALAEKQDVIDEVIAACTYPHESGLGRHVKELFDDQQSLIEQRAAITAENERLAGEVEELREHERQTHERLGAILGTDDSLEECAKRLKADRDAIKVQWQSLHDEREEQYAALRRNRIKFVRMGLQLEAVKIDHERDMLKSSQTQEEIDQAEEIAESCAADASNWDHVSDVEMQSVSNRLLNLRQMRNDLQEHIRDKDVLISELTSQVEKSRAEHVAALRLVADVRHALGDDGKRMQPEFIAYCKELRADRDEWKRRAEELEAALWQVPHDSMWSIIGLLQCNHSHHWRFLESSLPSKHTTLATGGGGEKGDAKGVGE